MSFSCFITLSPLPLFDVRCFSLAFCLSFLAFQDRSPVGLPSYFATPLLAVASPSFRFLYLFLLFKLPIYSSLVLSLSRCNGDSHASACIALSCFRSVRCFLMNVIPAMITAGPRFNDVILIDLSNFTCRPFASIRSRATALDAVYRSGPPPRLPSLPTLHSVALSTLEEDNLSTLRFFF